MVSYVERATLAGLSWPLSESLTDAALEQLLFPPQPKSVERDRALPDWSAIHRELQKKNVTLFLVWQEYREQHPKGFQYSWFCDQYQDWLGRRDYWMRQSYRLGNGRPMSDNTIRTALKSLGYDSDVMTAHEFRNTASTQLNEQGWSPDTIERHAPKDQSEPLTTAHCILINDDA